MRSVDLIAKKRDGGELSADEIDFFVQGFSRDQIPDYQVSAWAMAVLWRGMSTQETVDLTMAMVRSGDTVDLSALGRVVDKHSTGGVGDKTTLVVAPLVAACGLPVAKMSGRGLGFTGGTLDKLEAIPGYRTSLTMQEFMATVQRCGIVVAGQTADLVPADGKLYALRDVTATVPSLPLIASSIMSKKIAGGAGAIVLDVKCGSGAFMRTLDEARALAELMIRIGHGVDRQVTAALSGMEQPLGYAVGNAIEVQEAIAALQGSGPADLREHCLTIAAEMAVLGGVAETPFAARQQVEQALTSGRAMTKFVQWIEAQGGDVDAVAQPGRLALAPLQRTVEAPRAGYVATLDAREIGLTSVALGAGRQRKGDPVDPGVGLLVQAKVGDRVEAGQPLMQIYARSQSSAQEAAKRLLAATTIVDQPVAELPLFYEILRQA